MYTSTDPLSQIPMTTSVPIPNTNLQQSLANAGSLMNSQINAMDPYGQMMSQVDPLMQSGISTSQSVMPLGSRLPAASSHLGVKAFNVPQLTPTAAPLTQLPQVPATPPATQVPQVPVVPQVPPATQVPVVPQVPQVPAPQVPSVATPTPTSQVGTVPMTAASQLPMYPTTPVAPIVGATPMTPVTPMVGATPPMAAAPVTPIGTMPTQIRPLTPMVGPTTMLTNPLANASQIRPLTPMVGPTPMVPVTPMATPPQIAPVTTPMVGMTPMTPVAPMVGATPMAAAPVAPMAGALTTPMGVASPLAVNPTALNPAMAMTGPYAQEVQILRSAVTGTGTNEQAIIDLIARTNSTQRAMIRNLYTQTYGENLIKRLDSETSGDFNKCVIGAFMTPAEYDAYCLYKAMKGIGTNEGVLSEIIGSRSPYELMQIKQAYQMNYGETLEKAVEGDTSGDYRKLLLALLACQRSQSLTPDTVGCQQDAMNLYKAGEGKWGTDEDTFIRIFATRSPADLVVVNRYYKAQNGKGLLSVINSEFSGDIKSLLFNIISAHVDPPGFYADNIHDAVAGAGTNDSKLIRNIISRSEKDMPEIMRDYRQKYNSDLIHDVNSDTSGDYRKVLNAILLGYGGQSALGNYGLNQQVLPYDLAGSSIGASSIGTEFLMRSPSMPNFGYRNPSEFGFMNHQLMRPSFALPVLGYRKLQSSLPPIGVPPASAYTQQPPAVGLPPPSMPSVRLPMTQMQSAFQQQMLPTGIPSAKVISAQTAPLGTNAAYNVGEFGAYGLGALRGYNNYGGLNMNMYGRQIAGINAAYGGYGGGVMYPMYDPGLYSLDTVEFDTNVPTVPQTYNATPATYNVTPTSYDVTPATYNVTPTSYDVTPAAYNATPTSYDVTPTTYNATPTSYDVTPTTYNATPASYDVTGTTSYDVSPTSYDVAGTTSVVGTPTTYDVTPTTYNATPASYDVTGTTSYDVSPTSYDVAGTTSVTGTTGFDVAGTTSYDVGGTTSYDVAGTTSVVGTPTTYDVGGATSYDVAGTTSYDVAGTTSVGGATSYDVAGTTSVVGTTSYDVAGTTSYDVTPTTYDVAGNTDYGTGY